MPGQSLARDIRLPRDDWGVLDLLNNVLWEPSLIVELLKFGLVPSSIINKFLDKCPRVTSIIEA